MVPAAAPAKAASSTPSRLRSLQVLLAAACIVLGITIVVASSNRSGELDQAEAATDLVVANQQLRAALGRADAAAASAFLAGGVDQPEQRLRYGEAIAEATAALQRAAQTADNDEARAAVGELGRLLPTYTGLIETARANNRQQLPLGAAYLRSASELLRGDVTVQLDELGKAGEASFRDVDDKLIGGVGLSVQAALIAVLAIFAFGQRWLSGRTRRLLNAGVVGATGLLVVGMGWVSNSVSGSATSALSAIEDGYDRLSALSAIRADAYDQQALTTFALVDRGARESFYAQAATATNNVEARLAAYPEPDELLGSWGSYRERSETVVQTDLGGSYDGARDLVIDAISNDGSVGNAFERFDDAVVAEVDTAQSALSGGLDDARGPISLLRVVALVLGLVAAAVAAWGVQQRINDYR